MPGVVVKSAVHVGPSQNSDVVQAQYFVAGLTERGSVTKAQLVRGMSEYVSLYGGYETGNLYTNLQTFFEEGGERAWVYRVLDSAASTGGITLQDGSAVDTLQVDAASPGAWSDDLDIEVTAGDAANTFKVLVYLDDVLQYTSRDLADPPDAVAVLNTSSVNHLVVATDLDSVTTPPGDNPAVVAKTAMSGGANGSAPIEADYTDALDMFTYSMGSGAVAIPSQTGTGVWDALIANAVANHRVAFCGFGENDSIATVKTAAAAYYANANAEYAAFFYPWVKIPDPATSGLEVTVSPESFAAAARAKAVTQSGPWRAGAGLISEASFVSDLVTDIDKADGDGLDEKRINAIRKIGGGIRVYGARSVDSDEENWRYITMRDTVNYVVSLAEARLEDFVFQSIDSRGALFARIEASLVGLLDQIRLAGGLYEAFDDNGTFVDPGYSVEVSDALNPVAQLASGQVAAKVGLRVSSIGDVIEVTVTKSNLTASVV